MGVPHLPMLFSQPEAFPLNLSLYNCLAVLEILSFKMGQQSNMSNLFPAFKGTLKDQFKKKLYKLHKLPTLLKS